MSDLLALAERVEAAAGLNRDLDAKISLAVGGYSETKSRYQPEPFTSSLDAAMTLVPEGCVWGVGNSDDPSPSVFRATIMPPRGTHTAHAATPALALTAAALRARATHNPIEGGGL